MKTASAKAPEGPKIIRNGPVIVKIYRVENKGRESFTLSYHAAGKRVLKMFASLDEAVAEGKTKATTLANGELDALHLRAEDAWVYVYSAQMAESTGIPLDLLVKDAVEAAKVVGEVHLADKFIEIKAAKAKTASRRMAPISGNLVKWLKPHAQDEGRGVSFDNINHWRQV